MRVHLIRHAEAVPASFAVADDNRWLTERGRGVARSVGARLGELGVELDLIVTSPLVRAVQTAELIAPGVGYAGAIESTDWLRPSGIARQWADDLPALGVSVALIGHEPSIAALAAYLIDQETFPSLRKAQVVVVEDGRPGWFLDPGTGAKQSYS